ncbi:hypothetical protein O3P69_006434 [Scylla paramamosain]|uniref:CCHC-type domain-containing protein n=1 Tax=Scylla paramamosain TaxID=85552 RepID=A0AAW0U2E9_SCYPA
MGDIFDLKLIPEFDGSGTQAVVEWLEKLELVCKLRGVDDVASVIPLRLTGDTFAVYLQLTKSERKKTEKVKEALLAVSAVDSYVAYEQFVKRKLRSGEFPDVYLAEFRRLAYLFGGISDVCQLLRAGSPMESLDLNQVLARARAVIRDDIPLGSSSSEACLGATAGYGAAPCVVAASQRCYVCGGPNHLVRDCLTRQQAHGRTRRRVRSYKRGGLGHIASRCSGNGHGDGASAPASSHGGQPWTKGAVDMGTVSGEKWQCEETGVVRL